MAGASTAAFDERFALGLIGSAGEGGVSPYRRNFGEQIENLAGSGGYHWMAGNFLKYAGPKTAADLPIDSHSLIALAAPRLTFISYGVPEMGDALWLDQQGSYMATVAAGSVWKLLGAKDLGKGATIVTVLADYGNRYQSKLFNPDFLRAKKLPVPEWLARKSAIKPPFV